MICAMYADQIRHIGFVIARLMPSNVVKMRIVVQTIATMVFVHLAVLKVAIVRTTGQCVPLVINVSHGESAPMVWMRDIAMLLHSVSTHAINVFHEC